MNTNKHTHTHLAIVFQHTFIKYRIYGWNPVDIIDSLYLFYFAVVVDVDNKIYTHHIDWHISVRQAQTQTQTQ